MSFYIKREVSVEYQPIMTAEVKVDCYSGETCDKQRKYFDMYCDGDMEGGESDQKQIIIDLGQLPPGALVVVNYPRCPSCGQPREDSMEFVDGVYKIIGHHDKCDCGFNWIEWAESKYA
jgi:hypothetical protein